MALCLCFTCFACAKKKESKVFIDALNRDHTDTYDHRGRIIRDVYVENNKFYLAKPTKQTGVIVTWDFTWDADDALLRADVQAHDVLESKTFVKLTDKMKQAYYLQELGISPAEDTYVCMDKGAKDLKSGGYDMILFYEGKITSDIIEQRLLSGDGYAGTSRFCTRAKTFAKNEDALADNTVFVTSNLTARLDLRKDTAVLYTDDAVTSLFFNAKHSAYYKVIQPVEMYEKDVIGSVYTRTSDKPTVYNPKGKKVAFKGAVYTLPEAYGGKTVK